MALEVKTGAAPLTRRRPASLFCTAAAEHRRVAELRPALANDYGLIIGMKMKPVMPPPSGASIAAVMASTS